MTDLERRNVVDLMMHPLMLAEAEKLVLRRAPRGSTFEEFLKQTLD